MFYLHTEVQGLPVGKKWIVFVSHSTADKVWARERVVVPLRDPPYKKKVAASYHFMPDPSKYDDSGILKDMEKSCVIIIGLSNSYLNSGRWVLFVTPIPIVAATCRYPHSHTHTHTKKCNTHMHAQAHTHMHVHTH